jgi:Fe-S cluster biogenesis protein NfuA
MTALDRIERALDEKVRPVLRADGGNVEVVSFEGGALKVRSVGKCAGCPSAAFEIEELITAELRGAIPEARSVVVVTGVSGELLEAARSLMGQHRRTNELEK